MKEIHKSQVGVMVRRDTRYSGGGGVASGHVLSGVGGNAYRMCGDCGGVGWRGAHAGDKVLEESRPEAPDESILMSLRGTHEEQRPSASLNRTTLSKTSIRARE